MDIVDVTPSPPNAPYFDIFAYLYPLTGPIHMGCYRLNQTVRLKTKSRIGSLETHKEMSIKSFRLCFHRITYIDPPTLIDHHRLNI